MKTIEYQDQRRKENSSQVCGYQPFHSSTEDKVSFFLVQEEGKPQRSLRAPRAGVSYLEEDESYSQEISFRSNKGGRLERSDDAEEYREKPERPTRSFVIWSEEDDKKIFMLFKELGAKWTAIAKKFRNRNENQVKNRFYSTLRRVATKICSERGDQVPQKKEDLIRFVDEAFEFGHECKSKRGRKRKETEEENPGILASKPSPSLLDREERAKSEFSLKKKYQFKDLGGKKDFAAQALPPIASLLPTVPHYPTDDKYRIVQKIPFLFSRQPFVFPFQFPFQNNIFHQSFYQ